MPDLCSRPYKPDPKMACEACVWGRGDHAEWCDAGMRLADNDKPLTEAQLDRWMEQWVEA